MPPLPGVLAMLSPSQTASKSINSTTANLGLSTGTSCIAEMSARTDLVVNRINNDNKFEISTSTALNPITSVTSSCSINNNSIASMVPSKDSAASSSDSKNNISPVQSAAGGGGVSECGSTSDSGSCSSTSDTSSSSSGSSSGGSNAGSSTSRNQSKSPLSNNLKDSLNNSHVNAKNSSATKDSSKAKAKEESGSATNDSCDNKDNENGLVELSTEVDTDTNSSSMFGRPRKILLKSVNAHITCSLCNGYLIDATTIVECLHSFCHSCIMNYLRKDQYCPRCEMMINTTKHNNIKLDTTLQAIVYKLVPGLYEKELLRKRAFYSTRPDEAKLATPEQRGDDTEHLIFGPADNMSLSLEYADIEEVPEDDIFELRKPKYLQCPANFTVAHLKKFVFGKFGIDQSRFTIDIMYKVKTIVLADHYKMMDVAYIYTWKRDAPMKFFFRVKESENRPLRRKCNKLTVAPPKPIQEEVTQSKTDDEKEKREAVAESKTDDNNEQQEIKVEIKEEEQEVTQDMEEQKLQGASDLYSVPQDCMVVVPVEPIMVVETEMKSPKEKIKVKSEEELLEKKPVDVESSANARKDAKENPEVSQTIPARKESPERSHSDPRTEKLKITLVNKGKSSPKDDDTLKSKSSKSKSSKHSPPEPDDRKVENIKLKIGLSKQGSVTIINMSIPEANKKENVKPVKQDKEWKIKVRKDKDKDKSNGSHDKGKASSPHEKTVPPITIEIGKSNSPSRISNDDSKLESDDEVKKSEFLNSIDLAPIKSLSSPDKVDRLKTSHHKPTTLPTTSFTIKKPSMPPPPAPPSIKPSAASKRKSKEPVKAIAKKPRLDLPPLKSPVQPQIKVRTNLLETSNEKPAISFKLSPFPIGSSGEKSTSTESSPPPALSPPSAQKDREAERKLEDEKLMPAPPPLKMLDVFKRNGVKGTSKAKAGQVKQSKSTTSNEGFLRPIVTTSMAQNSKVPIVSNVMGNRTPIARRYPPILPKAQSKNPFASLAGEGGGFLQSSSAEIKPIQNGENKEIKIYGPPVVTSANSSQKPAVSVATTTTPMHQQSAQRSTTKPTSTNYLNAALLNSAKSKMGDIPLGCRTPIYTPGSPIYSPNSPQYMPNYNIPIQPTYKYTKTQSSATNYLQSILGSNKQLSNLFPAPPVKKSTEISAAANKSDANSATALKPNNALSALGKVSPEPTSERQTPVQSLLNSCNINIPSSLSITIRNESDDANSSKSSKMKHSSPVNNYIEILKLPDTTTITSETSKSTLPSPSDTKPSNHPRSPTSLKLSEVVMSSTNTSPPVANNGNHPKPDAQTQTAASKGKPGAAAEGDKKTSAHSTTQKSTKKTPSPEKKTSEKRKAEKRSSSDSTKSPKEKSDVSPSALKKFRPILPRSRTPPPNGPGSLAGSLPSLSANILTKLGSGNGKQTQAKQRKATPKASNLNTKAQQSAAASAKKALADATSQRKSLTPPASLPSHLIPSPPAPQTGGLSAELAAFLTQQRQLLQQQQQQQQPSQQNPFAPLMAAAAAGNPNFLPHLAGFHPAANINMQRAYLMEHLARMQKAGAEAMEKFMQLKNNNVSCVKSPSGSPGNGSDSNTNNSVANNVKNIV